jgi:hypothetical protein
MIHALQTITVPQVASEVREAKATTYCGLEGTMTEWHSNDVNSMHNPHCEVVQPYVPKDVVSQGRVVAQMSTYNDAVTCPKCKDLIRCV